MKVYLSVPLAVNRDKQSASAIAGAIADVGGELTSPWVLQDYRRHDRAELNVFERDKHWAEESDVIVADVSVPSTGVGMEIMAAHIRGKKVILAVKRGSVVSAMLSHMDGTETVAFDSYEDLRSSMKDALSRTLANGVIGEAKSRRGVKRALRSAAAPEPIGPYSQGVEAGGVWCSGQIGLDPTTGKLREGIVAQTEQALDNLSAVLKEAGLGLRDVVKTTVYMTDLGEFALMNEEYSKRFSTPFPARSTVQAAALPKGARVEIDAVAVRA